MAASMETSSSSDLAASSSPSKPSNLFVKLKMNKLAAASGQKQHICSVCDRSFSSGKALGGHIRIHMNNNRSRNQNRKVHNKIHQVNRVKAKKKRSSNHLMALKDKEEEEDNDEKQEENEEEENSNEVKVSCCICNKGFRTRKSLFGHMKNHPKRSWRGIQPPTSDKNSSKNDSCCSSYSDDDEAVEVDQKHSSASVCDLVKALPKWNWTNKLCRVDKEVIEAACALIKLSRDKSLDLGYQTKNDSPIDKTLSSGKASDEEEEKKKKRSSIVEFQWDKEKSFLLPYKKRPREENKMGKSSQMKPDEEQLREEKKKGKSSPMKPDEEEEEEEGEYRGANIIPSSQTPRGCHPKNPKGEVFEEGLNEADLYSKTLTPPPKAAARQAIRGNQVCSPKFRDFDLNEPYVSLDGDANGSQ